MENVQSIRRAKPTLVDLTTRVETLEQRMGHVEQTAKTAALKATEAADNTAQLLVIVTTTKGVAAFAKKHGPRMVAFVSGTLAAAGIGNPAVWKFIGAFF
jgi:hypothetical protein